MKKICIMDLELLKITKVTTYKIYFKYDDKSYLIIDDSEEDGHISLYERVWVRDNRLELHFINGAIACGSVSQFIQDVSKRRPKSLVYSNIDREYFVKKLVEFDFSYGLYSDEYHESINDIDKLRDQIRTLENKISIIQKDWRNTSNHGSKCYKISLKAQVAERVKGASVGEYCKEYNDYYGNSDPKYGGVLTDLYSLPVGTSFYVVNGAYSAYIWFDNHGDKCIITDENCIKLTENHHSLYIKK